MRLTLCNAIKPKKSEAAVVEPINWEAPGVRFLFANGYPANIVPKQNIIKKGAEIVLKPLAPSVLLKKDREALDHA